MVVCVCAVTFVADNDRKWCLIIMLVLKKSSLQGGDNHLGSFSTQGLCLVCIMSVSFINTSGWL